MALQELLTKFHDQFGYEIKKSNYKETGYCTFERNVEGDKHHLLILEDHRWEAARKDFNPKVDIGDWLIFSMLTNEERDWFGNYIESQYPLTYSEYKIIEEIIQELNKIPCDE